jgi:hypothetical protein
MRRNSACASAAACVAVANHEELIRFYRGLIGHASR